MRKAPRVAGNVLSNYTGKLLEILTFLFLTPFLVGHLGPLGFGLWTLTSSVVGYSIVLDFGMSLAVVRRLAECRVEHRQQQARDLLATSFCLYCGLAALLMLASLGFAPVFGNVFPVPADQRTSASWLIVILGLTMAVSFPGTTAFAALQGMQRYDLVSLIRTGWTLTSAAVSVGSLLLGGDVVTMVAANLPVAVMAQLVALVVLGSIAPELRFRFRDANWSLLRPLASFGSAVFVADSAEQLEAGSDQVVAGAFLGVAAVTPYAIALKLSQGASLLTDQFVKVLFPMAAELHAVRNRDHLRLLYATGTRLTLAINVPVTCTLIILAQPVLRVWVGEAYTADSWLATILLLSALAARSQAVGRTVLQAMGRQWPLAILGVCSGVANIVMSIALVGPLGLLGVAIGTLVPNVIVYLLIMLPFAVRTIGVPVLSALKEILWPALVPAVPCVAVLLALRELRDLSSLPLLVAAAAAGVVTYGVTYLSMSASKLERETCRGVASQGVRLASSLLKSH